MNASDILNLVNAGFTKDEIIKLSGLDNVPVQDPEAPVNDPAEEQLDREVTANSSDVNKGSSQDLSSLTAALDNKFNELFGRFDKMLKSMQDANLQSSRLPDKPELDDVLANIINPNK